MTTLARHYRAPLAAAGIAGALALAGCSPAKPSAPRPDTTAAAHTITFAVTGHGTAAVTWPGGTDTHAGLPWSAVSRIPFGADGVNLTVQLGSAGGQAACTITVDGKRLVSSLAQGANGRATCHTAGNAQGDD